MLTFQACDYCNCSRYLSDKYGNSTLPTVPSKTEATTDQTTTTPHPYDIVNNPADSNVSKPVDTSTPMAQKSCGIQILYGELYFTTIKKCIRKQILNGYVEVYNKLLYGLQ